MCSTRHTAAAIGAYRGSIPNASLWAVLLFTNMTRFITTPHRVDWSMRMHTPCAAMRALLWCRPKKETGNRSARFVAGPRADQVLRPGIRPILLLLRFALSHRPLGRALGRWGQRRGRGRPLCASQRRTFRWRWWHQWWLHQKLRGLHHIGRPNLDVGGAVISRSPVLPLTGIPYTTQRGARWNGCTTLVCPRPLHDCPQLR